MIYITDEDLTAGYGHGISEVFVTESTSPTVGKFEESEPRNVSALWQPIKVIILHPWYLEGGQSRPQLLPRGTLAQSVHLEYTNNRLTFEAYCDGILIWAIILTLLLPCTLANLTQISLPPRQLPLFLYLQLLRCKTKVLTGGNRIFQVCSRSFFLLFFPFSLGPMAFGR